MKIIKSLVLSSVLAIASAAQAAPVNINTASASEISQALTGIGKHKADAIVEYRDSHGPFRQAIDIQQVKGIGKSIYEKNKNDLLVD
jgi:competence protein ComEA